ncbi:MAG: MBL fold metallo-hydrolase [Xanthomonadales bacterium]|nr:MBL fold metallo-hydrolase [Xanthomonadales bacterium]
MLRSARWNGLGILPMAAIVLCLFPDPQGHAAPNAHAGDHPGCERVTARQCLELALAAMGGERKLAAITNVQLDIAEHRELAEQSYQQAPFLTTYSRVRRSVDYKLGRVAETGQNLWPESDFGSKPAESDYTFVASATGAVVRGGKGDTPGSLSMIDAAREVLALSPERLLLTAAATSDLHYLPAQTLRSTAHAVVAFQWRGNPVEVLLNRYTHLPDAMQTTRSFDDFWYAWGDVGQRVYFSNWKLVQGIEYPTTRIEERNGLPWRSAQVLDVKFNTPLDDNTFAMDAKAAAQSAKSTGWRIPFDVTKRITLAPGVDLFQGPWSVTIIRQDGGVLILEAPIGPAFTQGALDKARALYPSLPIKGVLTTSDSWPHIAGVREAVAAKLPVYALDLNLPILQRMVAAPHTLHPDGLQEHPQSPIWNSVSEQRQVGVGENRVVLYPLRGESTGRQYMVYFPGRRLLYASDTLVLESGNKLYDPELMHEVVQAVQRNRLKVDTVYAMHQGPVPWNEVTSLVSATLRDASPD